MDEIISAEVTNHLQITARLRGIAFKISHLGGVISSASRWACDTGIANEEREGVVVQLLLFSD